MLGYMKKSVCMSIVVLLMISSLGMVVSSNVPAIMNDDVYEEPSQDIEAVGLIEPVDLPPFDDHSIPKEMITVTIFTNNMGQLAIDLSGIYYEGSLGTSGDPNGLFVTLKVPSGNIEQISQMSSVLEVYVHPEMSDASTTNLIEPPVNTEGIPPTDPTSIYDVWQQGTVDAWVDDFIGTGVKVAVPYGIDFGTPDLQGRQARNTNASSPYYGWPMVFDRDSMDYYLSTDGSTDGTWYVNTSETASSSSFYFNTDIDNEFEWDNSIPVLSGIPDPQPSGMLEMMTVSGLEPETAYDFNIRAMDEAGSLSTFSTTPNATAFLDDTSPAAITDLVASTGPDHESVMLSFTATGDDGSAGIATEYIVKYSLTPIPNHVCFDHLSTEYTEALPAPQSSGSMENILLTGLDMGIEYYFTVIAVDEGGNMGVLSNDDSAIVKNDITPPARIDPNASTGFNSTEISLEWTASGDDGMSGTAESFELRYSTSDITTQGEFDAASIYTQTWEPEVGGTIMNYTLTMPAPSTNYYFSLVAIDAAGNSGPISAPASLAMSQGSDVISPEQITDLAVITGTDHGMVDLTFTAPGDDVDVGWATNYQIKFDTSPIDAGNWDTITEVFGFSGTYIYPIDAPLVAGTTQTLVLGVTNLDFSYLPPGMDYYFAMRAEDEEGNLGPVSNCDHAFVQDDSVPPEAITDLTAVESTNHGEVLLSWTAPGDDGAVGYATYYQIKYATFEITPANFGSVSDSLTMSVDNPGGFSESLDFSGFGLDLDTIYYFAIKALDEAVVNDLVSNCANSMARNDTIVPSPIDDLSAVTSNTHGEVILYWNSTGDDGNSGTADEYLVRYRESFPEYRYINSSSYEGGPIVSYNIIGIDSASGNYRLGFHPGENLAYYMNGGYPSKVLLVDSQTPGVYDTVYVDLDHDMDFSDEKPCVKGDEISYRDMDDNGLADISGGMIYFISDGIIPIPYSDVYAGKHGVDNIIPQNGDLVAFFGEFDRDSVIGTAHAASIAGQGKMSHKNYPDVFPVVGQAPDATIIGITDSMYDGMTFAVEGYDGVPGTGDEANIISNGLSFSTTYEDGFDTYSKYIDWLTVNYSEGNTAITATTGASGSGYGTVTSPGSAPGVITAGLATNFFYRILENQDTGPYPSYGDIIPLSGRGPTMMGTPKPDIVASGAYFSFVSQPLYTAYDVGPNAAYTNTVEIMGDHALTASTTAGGLALIYDAYGQTNGHYPISEEAKTLITSGADDLNYDALVQGAGQMNPGQSTKIASNTAGTKVSPTSWVPGDYDGERYEAFVNLIGPGTLVANLDQEFTIENTGNTAINADITAGEILKVGEGTIKLTAYPLDSHRWTILNQTGFWSPAGELISPMNESLWTDTTLAKVTMFSDNSDYWLELYDWTDEDGDGILDGSLEAGPYGSPAVPFAERNRMSGAFANGNVLECRVHDQSDPNRIHDGIAIWSRSMVSPSVETDLYLKVEYYSRQTWDWITFDESSLSINSGATGTFTATLDPAKAIAAGVGSYEGDIVSTVDGRKTVIPVVINVAADSPNFEFGGDSSINASETYTAPAGDVIVEGELALDDAYDFQMSFSLDNVGITNQTYLVIDGGSDIIISPYEFGGDNNETLLEGEADGTFNTLTLEHQDIVSGSQMFYIYIAMFASWWWVSDIENA
ncbi:MAG: S8 family serine peptidase, partial [Thermoplasmata archaeon]|nr:S8 family serine peptidase [Thermoplasmata archaeon]